MRGVPLLVVAGEASGDQHAARMVTVECCVPGFASLAVLRATHSVFAQRDPVGLSTVAVGVCGDPVGDPRGQFQQPFR